MDGLSFFPNASGLGQSAAPNDMMATLTALVGDKGEAISFDALISAQAAPASDGSESAAPTPAALQQGGFADISVIMQLLRVARNEAAPVAAMPAATTADSGAISADVAEALPQPAAPSLPAPLPLEAATPAKPTPPLPAVWHMVSVTPAALMTSEFGAELPALEPETTAEDGTPVLPDAPAEAMAALLQQPVSALPPAAIAIPVALNASAALEAEGKAETPLPSTTPAATAATAFIAPESSRKAPVPAAPLTIAAADSEAPTAPPTPTALPTRAALSPSDMAASLAPILRPAAAPVDGAASLAMIGQQAVPVAAESGLQVKEALVDFGERLLEIGNDDAWIDQIAKDIAATKSPSGHISFRLMPANLGRLDVAMMQNDQGVSVHVEAQNESAASLVAASQVRLTEELRQQGVRVNHTEVTYTANDAGRHAGQDQGRERHNAAAPFIETASASVAHGDREDKGEAPSKGRYA